MTARIARWLAAAGIALLAAAGVQAGPLTGDATAAPDDPHFGRLFLTPRQRAEIDARLRGRTEGAASTPRVVADASPRADDAQRQRVDGVVRRSGGPAVVWIDGVPHQVRIGQSIRDVPAARLDGDSVVLQDPLGRLRRLKPGESVDPQ